MREKTVFPNACIALCALAAQALAVSTSEHVSLTQGQHFRWQWIVEISLGSVGVVLNSLITWAMLTLDDSRRVFFYRFVVCISCSDLTFSSMRLAYDIAHLRQGGITNGTLCLVESMLSLMPIAVSMFSIAAMSIVIRRDLCDEDKMSQKEINKYIASIVICSVLIVFFNAFVPAPYGGAEPTYSGLYCFFTWSALVTMPVNFFIILIVPLLTVYVNVYITFTTVRESQAVLLSHGINEQAKSRDVQKTTKLLYFAASATLCYSPALFVSFYEFSTGQYFPAIGYALVGISATVQPCLLVPVLFCSVNADLREKIFGVTIRLLNSKNARILKVLPVQSATDGAKAAEYGNLMSIDTWMDVNKPQLRALFVEHCRKEYVLENLLFVDYARGYQSIAALIKWPCAQQEQRIEMELAWRLLEEHGKKIIDLFIQPQVAPLEINIPATMRARVVGVLCRSPPPSVLTSPVSKRMSSRVISFNMRTSSKSIWSSARGMRREVKYPPLSDCKSRGDFLKAFDECLACVLGIIETDVFPRFRKSEGFRRALERQTELA